LLHFITLLRQISSDIIDTPYHIFISFAFADYFRIFLSLYSLFDFDYFMMPLFSLAIFIIISPYFITPYLMR